MNKIAKIQQKFCSMDRKKKIIILAMAALAAILIISLICLYSWYRSSALYAAVRIGVAVAERDADTVFDSIEDGDREVLNLFMKMLFLDEQRAFDLIFPEGSRDSFRRVSLLDYDERSSVADVRIGILYRDGKEQSLTLRFVREDEEWKLSINELIAEIITIK